MTSLLFSNTAKEYADKLFPDGYEIVASPVDGASKFSGDFSAVIEITDAPIYGTSRILSTDKAVVVVEPEHHDRNSFEVNHSWTRQAVLFQDGTGWYQVQGMFVSEKQLIVDGKPIFAEDSSFSNEFMFQHIMGQRNTELRSAMLSRALELGYDFLAAIGYEEVENDGHISLWTYTKTWNDEGYNWNMRRANYLRLINMTVDDGTLLTHATESSSEENRKVYLEGVPAHCDTIKKAMNWRVGLPLDSDIQIGVRA